MVLQIPNTFATNFRQDYYPVAGDPIYGDLANSKKPDGSIIHSAIYLADVFVFTKNGDTVMYPWMLDDKGSNRTVSLRSPSG